MIDSIISLSPWAGCIVVMSFTVAAGFVVYISSYKLISKYKREDMKDSTTSLFRVVGMLVSLMLALAFSEVIIEMRTIRKAIQHETVAISDIFAVLRLYDPEATRDIQTTVLDYAQAIIDDDWPAMADGRLSQRVGNLKTQMAKGVLNLKPATTVQEMAISYFLADIDTLSDHRIIRLDAALAKAPVYLYVIIFGFLVTMACFGVYRPQAPLMVLVTFYTIFVGLVLYLVLALSEPFQSGIGVSPAPFEYLVETLQSEIR
ncbi:MAG: DUF4239 domain-containing protein [Deltaproteobacteria bacterium]|jgi:hypothetical protein|nr:DUF4239 domain-containing protein [Deltaproteobacteria bacterium]